MRKIYKKAEGGRQVDVRRMSAKQIAKRDAEAKRRQDEDAKPTRSLFDPDHEGC